MPMRSHLCLRRLGPCPLELYSLDTDNTGTGRQIINDKWMERIQILFEVTGIRKNLNWDSQDTSSSRSGTRHGPWKREEGRYFETGENVFGVVEITRAKSWGKRAEGEFAEGELGRLGGGRVGCGAWGLVQVVTSLPRELESLFTPVRRCFVCFVYAAFSFFL